MHFIHKNICILLLINTLVYAGYEDASSKKNSISKELMQKSVQAEYLKHYLNAYLKRQAKKDLDKNSTLELNPEPNTISANTRNGHNEKTHQFDGEFKESVRLMRRKQAELNSTKEPPKVLYTTDVNLSKTLTKNTWEGP